MDDATKTIKEWLKQSTGAERVQLACFLNEVMLPKEARREIIKSSIGIRSKYTIIKKCNFDVAEVLT